MKRGILLLALVLSTTRLAVGQAMPPPEPVMPEEYSPEEFDRWLRELRRFEVIAVGSFPITFFATSLVYDLSIYGSRGWDPEYAMGTQRDSRDIAIIVGTAAGVSAAIALTDLIIGRIRSRRGERRSDES